MTELAQRLPLVDTNVILRFALYDIPDQSARAIEFFTRLRLGLERAQITETVVFETVFVMQSFYKVSREAIRDVLLPVLQLANLFHPHRLGYPEVFELYVAHRKLTFADCFHAAIARELGDGTIISFDRGFDRITGIQRVAPPL
jgi:predicted nucleic acid-binding protein